MLVAMWEVYTRGIGSRLLEQLGWRMGEGLGATRQGRATPVGIDGALGDGGKPIAEDKHYGIGHSKRGGRGFGERKSVSRRRRRRERDAAGGNGGGGSGGGATKRAKRSELNVFEFLNKSLASDDNVGNKPAPTAASLSNAEVYQRIDALQKRYDKLATSAKWLAQSATRNQRRDAVIAARAAAKRDAAKSQVALRRSPRLACAHRLCSVSLSVSVSR